MTILTPDKTPDEFMRSIPVMAGGNTPFAAMYAREIREIIVRQAHRQPRTVQRALGPSELGHVCLAGETEVVTRQGIQKLRDLAKEGEAELLVPQLYKGSDVRKRWGRFVRVPVECFGEQELFEVTLRRNRDVKIVHATAEHGWYRSFWSGKQKKQERLTTADLKPGHKLTQLRRARPQVTTMMPFAVAQGVVFGDGTKGSDDDRHRPAVLNLYHNGKAEALLRFFPGTHPVHHDPAHAQAHSLVTGLPRHWKALPPIDESTSFLMSWLAGYFATDGSVTEDGHCTIYSAYREHLEFVREAAAICGIGYGLIRKYMRRGISGTHQAAEETPLYRLSLRRRDFPDWFFLIEQHAQRVRAADEAPERDHRWVVESVRATGRKELVYCAVTGEPRAFALADDLMTGNCHRHVVGKMAGEAITNHVADPWPSIVGTAVHAWLAEKFLLENTTGSMIRWVTEQKVAAPELLQHPGTADLYDAHYQLLGDWKILGDTTLNKIRSKNGPPWHYRVQMKIYAAGYRALKLPVWRNVLIALPRTKPTLDEMYCWEETYVPARDDAILRQVAAVTDTRRQVAQQVLLKKIRIEDVPRTPSEECYFCPFFRPQSALDGRPGCPGHSPGPYAGN